MSPSPMPIQLRGGEELPLGVVLHVRGLPVSATLSDGHRTAPDAWIVPLLTVSKLEILVARVDTREICFAADACYPRGQRLGRGTCGVGRCRRSPDSTARRSVRIGSSRSTATADPSSTRSTRRCDPGSSPACQCPSDRDIGSTNDRPSPAMLQSRWRVPPRRLPVLRPWTEATGTGEVLRTVVARSTKTAPELLDAAAAPRTRKRARRRHRCLECCKIHNTTAKPSSGSEPSALTGDGRHLAETMVERVSGSFRVAMSRELVSFCYARHRRAWHALPSCGGPPMISMSLHACAFRACSQARYLRAQELGEAEAGAALLRGVSD
jgi:hypothetical protein